MRLIHSLMLVFYWVISGEWNIHSAGLLLFRGRIFSLVATSAAAVAHVLSEHRNDNNDTIEPKTRATREKVGEWTVTIMIIIIIRRDVCFDYLRCLNTSSTGSHSHSTTHLSVYFVPVFFLLDGCISSNFLIIVLMLNCGRFSLSAGFWEIKICWQNGTTMKKHIAMAKNSLRLAKTEWYEANSFRNDSIRTKTKFKKKNNSVMWT